MSLYLCAGGSVLRGPGRLHGSRSGRPFNRRWRRRVIICREGFYLTWDRFSLRFNDRRAGGLLSRCVFWGDVDR